MVKNIVLSYICPVVQIYVIEKWKSNLFVADCRYILRGILEVLRNEITDWGNLGSVKD
jgi:hypothetical protein